MTFLGPLHFFGRFAEAEGRHEDGCVESAAPGATFCKKWRLARESTLFSEVFLFCHFSVFSDGGETFRRLEARASIPVPPPIPCKSGLNKLAS